MNIKITLMTEPVKEMGVGRGNVLDFLESMKKDKRQMDATISYLEALERIEREETPKKKV